MKCDFCSEPDVARIYASPRQVMQVFASGEARVEHHATGGWCACAACADLIDQADLPALSRRAAELIPKRRPDLAHLSTTDRLAIIEPIHRQFFELRENEEKDARN